MESNKKNIIEPFLERLKVKFTKKYIQKIYNKNPYKDTLFGISNMLTEYNIKNTAFKIKDRTELGLVEPPFVVNLDGNLVLIDKISEEKVSCILGSKKFDIPSNSFYELWDGTLLLAEPDEGSVEPDLKKHNIEYLFGLVRKNLFLATSFSTILIGLFLNNVLANPVMIYLFLTSLFGTYIGYLLMRKQMFMESSQADRICSMLKSGNCDSVLNSPAAKIMGVVGWSEIGLSYFISNILIVTFFPTLISYLFLINICALPYSIWSVWYQKYEVKQWCPLCLITQLLLWITFIANFIFGQTILPSLRISDFLITGCVYIMPLLIINMLSSRLNDGRYIEYLEQDVNNLRLKPEIFVALLKQQPYYKIDESISKIMWGNKESGVLITIVTNPHCTPCALLHKRVEKFLKKVENKVCIQYLFHSFNEELESSSHFLASVYLCDTIDEERKKEIYNDWFEGGRYHRNEFFGRYNLDTDHQDILSEIDKHRLWEGQKKIYGTPTIFVNGYQLPEQYEIEDLIYFLDLNF